ncbi:GNAT family N-acetyltransferase [Streptomyces sp. NRRL S-337]|uniref:GNAT family N-acetyltransferase n=1 Tax=Streptomyces sp. NRRL S-337 TaxID=1463900 RepID=UPI0004C76C61|nr:GNAT family N-acetyltransferase [Streptomyces sp. NRRL S-337]
MDIPTTGGGSTDPTPTLLDAAQLTADRDLAARFPAEAHRVLADLVRAGAPLGWDAPPAPDEVADLIARILRATRHGDAALRAVYLGRRLIGLGYWLRYAQATNRQHADLVKIAVAAEAHGRGIGRSLTSTLVADAREAKIEVLTLDARADNTRALRLYRSLGFREYGRLPAFVAMGGRRYDKVFYMLDLRTENPTTHPPHPTAP